MKKQFKISIPKPCHEDWSAMTPKEKGRFCQSCSKTVVDFTKKSKEEIQQYLSENFGKRVCGHFRREQLDTVTLEIPTATFHQSLSYQKLFLLALLFVMGTTLFSCQNSNGKKQKIEDVVLIDSIPELHTEIEECTLPKDSDKEKQEYYVLGGARSNAFQEITGKTFSQRDIPYSEPVPIDSIIEIEEEEEIIEDVPNTMQSRDSIATIEELEGEVAVEVLGDIVPYEEEVEEVDILLGYIIEEHPKFPEAKSLSGEKAREDFNQRMRLFFQEHFKTPQGNLGLTGKRLIIVAFEIDTLGQIQNMKTKSPHPAITKEVERVLKKLPTFIPGEQRGKLVTTRYTLPIRMVFD